MNWALKRQITLVIIFFVFISAIGFVFIYPSFKVAPSCVDNKQNGDELGVDCGGSCSHACLSQVDSVAVLWSRSFKVIDGRYNAVAYLENHNKSVAVDKISYKFRFADKDNVYIGKREGVTTVPPSGKFAIFEPAIDVGYSIPVYTTFEFTQVPDWVFVAPEKLKQLNLSVSNAVLQSADKSPMLSATINNDSIYIIPNVNVVAILYDASHNALAASNTYIESLDRGERKDVNFIWPLPIGGNVVVKEILPVYNFFTVKLK